MSHSSGAVRFQDGTIKHVEYNGTVDVLQPKMFNTYEELQANWRTTDWCICDCIGEPVEIVVNYGYGFGWHGFACQEHNCAKTLTAEDSPKPFDGLPDWYTKYIMLRIE